MVHACEPAELVVSVGDFPRGVGSLGYVPDVVPEVGYRRFLGMRLGSQEVLRVMGEGSDVGALSDGKEAAQDIVVARGLGSHLQISLCQKCRCDPFFTRQRQLPVI